MLKFLPQIIMLLLVGANLTYELINHGKPKNNHHFGCFLFATVITQALLYWGGFYNIFK